MIKFKLIAKTSFALIVLLLVKATPLVAQNDDRKETRDSLYAALSQYLDRNSVDSALATTDYLYQLELKSGTTEGQVRAKIHRAEILRAIASLELAFEALNDVAEQAKSLQPSTVKSYYYNRLAAIEFERKNKKEALKAVKESQHIDSLKNFKWRIFSNLNILGSIYRDNEQWDKAVETLELTIEKAVEANDTSEMYQAIRNITMAYYRMGAFRKAIDAGFRYQNYTTPAINRNFKSDNFRLIARSYHSLGIYDSAYQFLDSAHKLTLDGLQEMVLKRTDGYRVASELEKQKLENSILVAEQDKAQLRSLMLFVVLFLLILIAFIFYRQKQNYKTLNIKQQELNTELESSLVFKNKLIGIVAHDIRNPLSSLTGMIHLYNEGLVSNADMKDMMSKLEASAVSVNFLIENLLNWVLSQKQALKPNPKSFNLSDLVDKTCLEAEAQLKAKDLSLQVYGFKSDELIESDQSMLSLVIRNLLSNAIKFSNKGSEIIVSYEESESFKTIKIKDFGLGMANELINRLLSEDDSSQSLDGTASEKGTGLGIALSKDFLKVINGSLDIKSKEGQGSEILIKLYK